MRCEICGREIIGREHKIIIEKAKLMVCYQCSKHGDLIHEKPLSKTLILRKRYPPLKRKRKKSSYKDTVNSELVENFGGKIREARERLELSHKELSKKINEKISVLKKLETEKMIPDQKLVSKLEYALKIKLFMHTSEKDISQSSGFTKTVNPEITLGDLIQFNKDD